jgi:hypothetical protein
MAREMRSYKVGYAKPPEDRRFQPGRSGNPKGRPKSETNADAIIARELNKEIMIYLDGARSTVTRREAIVLQLLRKAIQGDVRALTIALRELRKIEPKPPVPDYVIEFYEEEAPDQIKGPTDG